MYKCKELYINVHIYQHTYVYIHLLNTYLCIQISYTHARVHRVCLQTPFHTQTRSHPHPQKNQFANSSSALMTGTRNRVVTFYSFFNLPPFLKNKFSSPNASCASMICTRKLLAFSQGMARVYGKEIPEVRTLPNLLSKVATGQAFEIFNPALLVYTQKSAHNQIYDAK